MKCELIFYKDLNDPILTPQGFAKKGCEDSKDLVKQGNKILGTGGKFLNYDNIDRMDKQKLNTTIKWTHVILSFFVQKLFFSRRTIFMGCLIDL